MRKKIFITISILLIIFFILTINVYASFTIDPNDYKPDPITNSDTQQIVAMSSVIVTTIRTVGVVVFVIVLMVLGIKYMVGTVEERADYKKSMIPYIIGAFIFFALSQILSVIIQIAESLES